MTLKNFSEKNEEVNWKPRNSASLWLV